MCFGNTTTGTQTQTYQADPSVSNAATQNLDQLSQLMSQGYQPYQGNRVADFSDLQNKGFAVGDQIPGSNPNAQQSQDLINSYANAGPQSVQANSIASQMGPYMSQYVQQALQPQLEAQKQQFAQQNQNLDAAATSAGAFGDSRAGIQAANLTNQQDIAHQGLIGNAYNAAFNTAIGAGAQDVSNQMAAQGQTGQFAEQALARQLGGANALTGLSGANLGYMGNSAGIMENLGGLQQQQNQARLNVPYSDYLAAQQYPIMLSQAMNGAINSGSNALKGTTTTTNQQPNNSGYALLGGMMPSLFNGGSQGFSGSAMGSGLGGLGSMFGSGLGALAMFSDKRLKDNLKEIGKTADGIPIKSFTYKNDPHKRPQYGLVAQDVEKARPEAVSKDPITGFKKVNYGAALAPRRQGLEDAFGRMAA